MRFIVPQYITVEDKLRLGFFSFTFPQLFIGFGVFIICFIIFKFIGGMIALFLSGIIVLLGLVVGWVKVNNKYVYVLLPKLIMVLFKPKKYIWKEEVKITTKYIKAPTLEKYIELAEMEELPKEKEPKIEEKIRIEPEKEIKTSLVNYVKKAISRGYNPYDPYINFPIPKFPKRRW